MAIGRGKKKKTSAEGKTDSPKDNKSESKVKKLFKGNNADSLLSVVDESEPGSALTRLAKNENFVLDSGQYLILVLPTKSIGGLSSKSTKDEDKGSIVQLIKGGKIDVAVTHDMLVDNCLGIIPDEGTLSRMAEFSILTNPNKAKYFWCVVEATDEGELDPTPNAIATFEQALEISRGNISAYSVLSGGDNCIESHSSDEEEDNDTTSDDSYDDLTNDYENEAEDSEFAALKQTPSLEDSRDLPDSHGDNNTMFDNDTIDDAPLPSAEVEVDENGQVVSPPPPQQEQSQSSQQQQYQPPVVGGNQQQQSYQQSTAQYTPPQDNREFSDAVVESTITRRFLGGDLNLNVDVATFNKFFNNDADIIQFSATSEFSDWLGGQAVQLVENANSELKNLHARHVSELREMYLRLMHQNIESITAAVDPGNEASYYSSLKKAASTELAARRTDFNRLVNERQKALTRDYEASREFEGKRAYDEAVARYDERNKPTYKKQMNDTRNEVSIDIQTLHDDQMTRMNDMRRLDAIRLLEAGETKILDILAVKNEEFRRVEQEAFTKWNRSIIDYINANRTDDVIRTESLRQRLSRDTQLAEQQMNYEQRIRELTAQRQVDLERAEEEKKRILEDNARRLQEEIDHWEKKLAEEKSLTLNFKTRYNDVLEDKRKALEEQAAAYALDREALQQDKKVIVDSSQLRIEAYVRANRILQVLLVVLCIACLLVGLLVGLYQPWV